MNKKLNVLVAAGVLALSLAPAAFAGDLETITVAASSTPHAEILAEAVEPLKELGYDLQVTEFSDYVQPNEVVYSGDMDANYFQHVNYLEAYDKEHNEDLVNAGSIHYEPFGIYGGTKKSLDEIADGDTVAVPNDTTNEARALMLLQAQGWIKLADGVDITATVNDIVENPYNLDILEFEAQSVARHIDEVSYVVLNGNYALEAGLNAGTDALAVESSDSAAIQQYVNVIAVKDGNQDLPKIQALVSVLKSDEIKQFIEDKYQGAVVPYEEPAEAETEGATEAE